MHTEAAFFIDPKNRHLGQEKELYSYKEVRISEIKLTFECLGEKNCTVFKDLKGAEKSFNLI